MSDLKNDGTDSVEMLPPAVEEALKKPSLDRIITRFFRSIDSLAESLPWTMALIGVAAKDIQGKMEERYNPVKVKGSDGKDYTKFTSVNISAYREFERLSRRSAKTHLATRIVPQSFLVSLVSQFDAFIGDFVRCVYALKPELLNASNRQMTYSDLVKIGSVAAAREVLVDKEIDEELRGSHTDIYKWLEKFANIEIIANLRDWPKFIELTERRNLFVHTGGSISRQYLEVCKKNSIPTEGLKNGDELDVSAKYFEQAYECILETGLITAQTIWRQIFPKQLVAADHNLNAICMEIIQDRNYQLASTLLDYSDKKLKHDPSSERIQLILKINRAQTYKWRGDVTTCVKILDSCDWSAKSIEFVLAEAVLREDFENAAKVMKRIGRGPDCAVSQANYSEWPLFRNFRKTEVFLSTFQEIYETPFELEKTIVPQIDMIGSLKDLKIEENNED